jgi:hypothetical protein
MLNMLFITRPLAFEYFAELENLPCPESLPFRTVVAIAVCRASTPHLASVVRAVMQVTR